MGDKIKMSKSFGLGNKYGRINKTTKY